MNASLPAAIQGVFSDLKSVKTRSVVQLVVEIPIEQAAEVVKVLGWPQPGSEIPVVVARLQPMPKSQKLHREWDQLPPAEQAGIACNDARFRRFLAERYKLAWDLALSIVKPQASASQSMSESAAITIRAICKINSRSVLNRDRESGERWQHLHEEFQAWLTMT